MIERERTVRSVLNGPSVDSVLFLSQPLQSDKTVLRLGRRPLVEIRRRGGARKTHRSVRPLRLSVSPNSLLLLDVGIAQCATYGDGAAEQISLGEHLFFSLENIFGISRTGLSAGRHCAATANSEIGKGEESRSYDAVAERENKYFGFPQRGEI